MTNYHITNDRSDTKIGIIGSKLLVEQTRETLKAFPNFNPIFHILQASDDFKTLILQKMTEVEVLLFTDYQNYRIAKQQIDFTIPVHHIPLMGTGLFRALFIIKNSYNLNTISVDSVEERYVNQILSELDKGQCQIIPFQQTNALNVYELVKFHLHNYHTSGAIALTGIEEVANELHALAVPYEWVTPTQQDMSIALERALLATKTRRDKESQIVFGLVNIDNMSNTLSKYTSEHDVQLLKISIQQMLLDYVKQLDGHLITLGGEEYSFITTRGIFERETRGYKFIPLLQDAKTKLGITFSLGVGFGLTAAEAGNHARLALSQSIDLGGNVCYIVREDRSVLGPVDITTHTQYERYDLAITDPELLEKAEKAGMSAAYMTKIMARVARHQKVEYTAQDLATTLKVTVRSAHRILLKLMDAELVDIIGEEKLTHRGRPRRIYRLTFVDDVN